MRWLLAPLCLCLAPPLAAQQVSDCDWRGSAAAIAEPWQDNTRSFAGGAIRVALSDTEEPAAAAMHLIVLSPDPDHGYRRCHVISASGSLGYAALDFASLAADYDPAVGLVLSLDGYRVWEGEAHDDPIRLTVTVNQATGAITARQQPGAR